MMARVKTIISHTFSQKSKASSGPSEEPSQFYFIFTLFIGTLKEIWASGNWANLISFKVFFPVGLFIFSLFIPKIIKKFSNDG